MIIARQVNPEWQESYMFYCEQNELNIDDDFYTDKIAIYGNSDYMSYECEAFMRVREVVEGGYVDQFIEYGDCDYDYYKNLTECVSDLMPPMHKDKYNTKDIHAIKDLFSARFDESDLICGLLGIMTGKAWEHKTIHGCCQGDWNELYYSEELTDRDIEYIETNYFNTGSEWVIEDGEELFHHYSTEWDDEKLKKELADIAGTDNIKVLAYDGNRSYPIYREV